MPLYEYKCPECGPFESWRSIAESSDPMMCGGCQEPALRVFSPPMILSSGFTKVRRHGTPEPRLVTPSRDREPEKPKVQNPTGGRPWMISH